MNAKMVLAALAMLIAGTWWYVASDRTSEPLVNGAPAAVERELAAAPPSTHDVPDGAGERERVASEPVEPAAVAPASPEVAQPALATWTVRARVLDADARPIVGLSVRVDGEPATLTTERDGVLSFATRVDRGRLVVADERWVTVRAGLWSRGSSYEPILIAAPSVAIAGVVRDAAGDPLEHARIELLPPDDLASRFETILEATEQRAWLATSDRDGRFELAGVPSIAGARLRAALEGYQTAFAPAPTQDDPHVDFELARPAVELEGRVAGKVIDANGEPIEGARVALGLASTLTDADGGFAIDLDRAVTADAIVAVREGFQPAREERPSDGRWPELVVLRLGEPALSISGRVIDADRNPVAGAKLWISDPTPFGVIGVLPASLENLMAGAAVPPQALEAPNPPRDGNGFWDWYMRAGPPSAVWNWVATDADGRFELSGLADRDYRFQVLIQKPLYIHATGAVRAGDRDVTIQLDAPKLHAKLAGRVVDARGRPVADVRVRCRHNVADVRGRIFGGRTQLVAYEPGASATSDADGRFELVDVPRHGVEIDFSQEEIVPHKVLLDPAHEGELVVRVHVRCHLQVELDEPTDRADEIAFADEDGEGLDVLIIAGGSINAFTSVDLSNGRSEVVSVSSQARTLLLLKGGEVVQRVAIDLVPGEINRLRL